MVPTPSQTQQWIDEAARLRRLYLDPIDFPSKCLCEPNGVDCDIDTCSCPLHWL